MSLAINRTELVICTTRNEVSQQTTKCGLTFLLFLSENLALILCLASLKRKSHHLTLHPAFAGKRPAPKVVEQMSIRRCHGPL